MEKPFVCIDPAVQKQRERERYEREQEQLEIEEIAKEIIRDLESRKLTKSAQKAQLVLDRASDLIRAAAVIDLTRL